MRLTHRREPAGAISGVIAVFAWLFVLVFLGGIVFGRADAATVHTQSGADAVAHAIALVANHTEHRDDLSIQVQAGRLCWSGDDRPVDFVGAADDLCAPLMEEGRRVARDNAITIVTIRVGPDIRDQLGSPQPGRLGVLVIVRGEGPLARIGALCSDRRFARTGWCHPEAASAAEATS